MRGRDEMPERMEKTARFAEQSGRLVRFEKAAKEIARAIIMNRPKSRAVVAGLLSWRVSGMRMLSEHWVSGPIEEGEPGMGPFSPHRIPPQNLRGSGGKRRAQSYSIDGLG